MKTNVPVYIEEDGVIYELNSVGEKRFVKRIENNHRTIPKKFQLS